MTAVAEESATDEHSDGTGRRFSLNGSVRGVVLTSLLLLLLYASAQSDQLGRLYSISWKIVLVVGLSAAVFVGANLLISQGRRNWARYRALAGGLLGAAGFGLLRGNRSVSTLVADSEFIFTRDEGEPFVVVDPAQIDAISKVAELRSGLAEYATGGFASLGTFEWPLVGLVLGLVAGRTNERFVAARPCGCVVSKRAMDAVGAAARDLSEAADAHAADAGDDVRNESLLAATLVLASVAVGLVTAAALARPARDLQAAARRVEAGDFESDPVPVRGPSELRETGRLAHVRRVHAAARRVRGAGRFLPRAPPRLCHRAHRRGGAAAVRA